MKKYISFIALLFSVSFSGCLRSPHPDSELSSPFKDQDLYYIGSFYNNHAYIDTAQDYKLADGYVASIYIYREDRLNILRDPKNGKMVALDPSSEITDPDNLKFSYPPSDSPIVKAWSIASGQVKPTSIENGHDGRQWAFVDNIVTERQIEHLYIDPTIVNDPKTGITTSTLLILVEQRMLFFYDSKGTKIAPVTCDFFWTPVDELQYRVMKVNGIENAVWEFINDEPSLTHISIILLKAIIGWVVLMILGTNIIGFIIRNLPRPYSNEYGDNQYLNKEILHQKRASLFLAVVSIIIAIVYFYLLYYFWNIGVSVSAAMVMLSRIPDLLYEMKTGEKITLTSMPRRPINYFTTFILWAALPVLWYSFYIQI